jgi:hypothetical protein
VVHRWKAGAPLLTVDSRAIIERVLPIKYIRKTEVVPPGHLRDLSETIKAQLAGG